MSNTDLGEILESINAAVRQQEPNIIILLKSVENTGLHLEVSFTNIEKIIVVKTAIIKQIIKIKFLEKPKDKYVQNSFFFPIKNIYKRFNIDIFDNIKSKIHIKSEHFFSIDIISDIEL